MTQTTIFDVITATERGNAGIAAAADNHASAVLDARRIAHEIGRRQRRLSMNDVNREWTQRGRRRSELGNGAGAVFRDRAFRRTSQTVRAEHIDGRGRWLPVWEYIGS